MRNMNPLKTLIIDDEWLIRLELRKMLKIYDKIDVVGEASNVTDARQLIQQLQPDVIFLDIQMTDESGFDLLRKNTGNFKTIFVSAFENFKKEAQAFNPVDFLMKPINRDKLCGVIEKL